MKEKLREIRSCRFGLQEEINKIDSIVEEYEKCILELKKQLVMIEVMEQKELNVKKERNKKKVLR